MSRPAGPTGQRRLNGGGPRAATAAAMVGAAGIALSPPVPGRARTERDTARERADREARRQTRADQAARQETVRERAHRDDDTRTRTRSRPRAAKPASHGSILGGALAVVRGVPDAKLLERLIGGRFWIPMIGAMLAGIVFLQVEVLRYGATMGRAVEQTTALQSRNELLRASVAQLSNVQRIEQLAERAGMVMPPPTGVGFVNDSASIRHALANIHPPDASTFGMLSTTNGGMTTAADETTAVIPPNDQG